MIYDVKCDDILQVSNQEPSTSSKPPILAFSAKSCRILIKLSGYLPNHLSTWSMMSNATISSKLSIRNPQRPPSPQFWLSQQNHGRSWSNSQDKPLSNYQPDIWCERWPHASSLESGTLSSLWAPKLGFLSQIMTKYDPNCRIGPLVTTNIIFDVQLKMTSSFKSPVRNPQCPPESTT